MDFMKKRQAGGEYYDQENLTLFMAGTGSVIYISACADAGSLQLYRYGNNWYKGQFSLQNYVTLFTTPELRGMIGGTFLLAFGSALVATILGTIGAIGAFYCKKGPKQLIQFVNQIPVINADVVTGFSLCVLMIVVLGMDKETLFPLIAVMWYWRRLLSICLCCPS